MQTAVSIIPTMFAPAYLYSPVQSCLEKQRISRSRSHTQHANPKIDDLPKVLCSLGNNIRVEFHFHTSRRDIADGNVKEYNRPLYLVFHLSKIEKLQS